MSDLQTELDQMTARVAELEECASRCLSAAADDYSACSEWCYEQSNIINRTPAQSLSAIKADALEKEADRLVRYSISENSYKPYTWAAVMKDRAKALREGRDDG